MGKRTVRVLLGLALFLLVAGGGALVLSYAMEMREKTSLRSWKERESALQAEFSLYRERIETMTKQLERGTAIPEIQKAADQFRADLRKSSLPPEVRQGLLIDAASGILAKAPATFKEALEYRKIEQDHPYLKTLVGTLRGLRELSLPLFQEARALESGSGENDRRVQHMMAYTAGVIGAWLAEVEPDYNISFDEWLLSFKAHVKALEEKPGDVWTQENLEIIDHEVRRRYGGELDDPLLRESWRSRKRLGPGKLPTLPQKGRAAPGVPKGKM